MNSATAIIAGFLISLSGSLPLGSLSLTAMHIAAVQHARKAIYFSIGVVLVEMLYLAITLCLLSRILSETRIFTTLQWAAVVFLIALALNSFFHTARKEGDAAPVKEGARPFVLGLSMSAVNPMQLPFWAGWIAWLLARKIPLSETLTGVGFVLGAAAGTLCALFLFLLLGKKLSGFLKTRRKLTDIVIGLLYLALAAWQTYILL